jgi:hypothetical protein
MEWRDVRDDTLAVLAAFAQHRLASICRTMFRSHALRSESESVSPTEAGRS